MSQVSPLPLLPSFSFSTTLIPTYLTLFLFPTSIFSLPYSFLRPSLLPLCLPVPPTSHGIGYYTRTIMYIFFVSCGVSFSPSTTTILYPAFHFLSLLYLTPFPPSCASYDTGVHVHVYIIPQCLCKVCMSRECEKLGTGTYNKRTCTTCTCKCIKVGLLRRGIRLAICFCMLVVMASSLDIANKIIYYIRIFVTLTSFCSGTTLPGKQ